MNVVLSNLDFILAWGQACMGLEDTEERRLIGEAWFDVDLGDFDVRTAFEQLLGVLDAIVVDQLDEGDTLLGVDTVGNISFVGTQLVGNISHFQLAVQIESLLFQQIADALYQYLVCISWQSEAFRIFDDRCLHWLLDG